MKVVYKFLSVSWGAVGLRLLMYEELVRCLPNGFTCLSQLGLLSEVTPISVVNSLACSGCVPII